MKAPLHRHSTLSEARPSLSLVPLVPLIPLSQVPQVPQVSLVSLYQTLLSQVL
jgi:hypothetical protein